MARLEISEFPDTWTERDLVEKFSKFGTLKSFKLVQPGAKAWIQFTTSEAAQNMFVACNREIMIPLNKLTVVVGSAGRREVKTQSDTICHEPRVNRSTTEAIKKMDFTVPPPNLQLPVQNVLRRQFSPKDFLEKSQPGVGTIHDVKVTSVLGLPRFWVMTMDGVKLRENIRKFAAETATSLWNWDSYPTPGAEFLLNNERVEIEELVGPKIKLFYLDKGASVLHNPFPALRYLPKDLVELPKLAFQVFLETTPSSVDEFKRELAQAQKLQLKVIRVVGGETHVKLFDNGRAMFSPGSSNNSEIGSKRNGSQERTYRNEAAHQAKKNVVESPIPRQDNCPSSTQRSPFSRDKQGLTNPGSSTVPKTDNGQNATNKPRRRPEVEELVAIMDLQKLGIKPGSTPKSKVTPRPLQA